MKISVYLPEDLGSRVKEAGLNVSTICQRALTHELVREAGSVLDQDQLRGHACIYCGATDRRSLVLEFSGGGVRNKIELFRCAPTCQLPTDTDSQKEN